MSVLTGLEQDSVDYTSSVYPTYGGTERVKLVGALVVDSDAVANLAWRPRGIVVDYLLKSDL